MSMPPQGPADPSGPNPSYSYGNGSPAGPTQHAGEWTQNRGERAPGERGQNQGEWTGAQGDSGDSGQGQAAWGQDRQPDPYQQQYDVYAAPRHADPQDPGYPQPGQGYAADSLQPYDASLSTASMHAPGVAASAAPGNPPAGPGWQQPLQQPPQQAPQQNNRLPWIVGGAIIVVGAVVATILLVSGKGDDKSADTGSAGQSQTQDVAPNEPSDDSAADDPSGSDSVDDEATASPSASSDGTDNAGSGSGNGSTALPASFPVPASVTIDESGTYCSGSSCFGTFDTDDPAAAYDDWVAELEAAGYTITTKEITGSGTNAIWAIEATGELEIIMYWAGTGVLTTS